MSKKQEPDIRVTLSSGNVFADLGFAEPEEELAKAQLASHIRRIIRRKRLTQVAAAALMGIDQPKVSALFNGRLASFSTDRLLRLLTACSLGRGPRPRRGVEPGIPVTRADSSRLCDVDTPTPGGRPGVPSP